ncbi:NADPH-cytochrome P450 reductase [Vermiconidia calcicola]|uniref:NADPH-cytochrome P450 reductase n=1 Tax=Vermiconidia calcicola TaxID=1690605 RepID=A0ACC3MWZ2_9PEZI|nr:NADPH-cytochrome P450 reductase [Vermiconidia calcicola]
MAIHTQDYWATAGVNDLTQLYQHVAFDDLAATAVLATLAMLYLFRGTLWDRQDPHVFKMYERPQEKMGARATSQGSTRDIAEKLQQADADIVVLWGSQSGTAEKFANRLSREIRQRFGKSAIAADVSDYEPASLGHLPNSSLAIFIVSTYGEGEPSDNMNDCWSWLESTSGAPLAQLKYVTFGLGNSNYKYYNAVADRVAARLDSLGAHAFMPIARADDAKGETEEHYLDWKSSLFSTLKDQLKYQEHDPVYEPFVEVLEDSSLSDLDVLHGQPFGKANDRRTLRTKSPTHALPVTMAKELFQNTADRNCIHMELDLSEQPGVKYKTGDHVGIFPSNPVGEVERLLQCLGCQQRRQLPISIAQLRTEDKLNIPTPTTLDALLGYYLEICAPVSRETIASLVQFAPTSADKDALSSLNTDKAAYAELQHTRYITLGSLMQHVAPEEGAWSGLPLSFILETLPAMQPRYYSISSSSVVQPRRVALTAVVADKALPGTQERVFGLCTNFLLALKSSISGACHPFGLRYPLEGPQGALSSTKVFAHIRKSTFRLPTLPSHPIVMVAAGTGIAPFRGFLQERARLSRMGREVGRMILVFGCRNEQDFIYQDELLELQQALGSSLTVVTAFSRPVNGSKTYVQDRIAEHSKELCDLLTNSDANFYICGSAAMARDVSKTLETQLQSQQNWDGEQVRGFMEKQRRTKRWHQDVWG